MNQRLIVVFLHVKGLSAKDVHTELRQVFGSDDHLIVYSTVTKYIRNDIILQNELEAEDRAKDQYFSIPDKAILEAFETMPFASICQIAKMIFIPLTTVFRCLTKYSCGPEPIVLAPHWLSDLRKQTQAIMPKELPKLLEPMRHHSWKYIVMLDEA
jgi:hypothetical protein